MTSTDPRAVLDLSRRATRELRKAIDADGPARTRHLRATADLLVDLRALHLDHEGAQDWRGKTFAYRDLVRSIYSGAGLSPDSSDSTKTALRYHVGNVLRERVPADELDAAGLSALDPRERQQHRRADLEEAAPQTVDRLIANVSLAVRRLADLKGVRVSPHDRARAVEACRVLDEWLKAHPPRS